MRTLKTRNVPARIVTVTLVGGIAAGLLMATAIPTTIQRQHEVTWRNNGYDGSVGDLPSAYPFPLYAAPPEDTTPVAWQPAPVRIDRGWDDGAVPEPALQEEDVTPVLEVDDADIVAGPRDEAADDAARAAQMAAEDVRNAERNAESPDGQDAEATADPVA